MTLFSKRPLYSGNMKAPWSKLRQNLTWSEKEKALGIRTMPSTASQAPAAQIGNIQPTET